MNKLTEARKATQESMEKAATTMKASYDINKLPPPIILQTAVINRTRKASAFLKEYLAQCDTHSIEQTGCPFPDLPLIKPWIFIPIWA